MKIQEEFIKKTVAKHQQGNSKIFFEADVRHLLDIYTQEILWHYSNWLHKKGYLDSDYYCEDPKAVDYYLNELEKFDKKQK